MSLPLTKTIAKNTYAQIYAIQRMVHGSIANPQALPHLNQLMLHCYQHGFPQNLLDQLNRRRQHKPIQNPSRFPITPLKQLLRKGMTLDGLLSRYGQYIYLSLSELEYLRFTLDKLTHFKQDLFSTTDIDRIQLRNQLSDCEMLLEFHLGEVPQINDELVSNAAA